LGPIDRASPYVRTPAKTRKLKLCYDRRSVCLTTISSPRPDFYYCQTDPGLLMWCALYDERTGLSFTIAAGPRQRSHSRVLVPRNSSETHSVPHPRSSRPGFDHPYNCTARRCISVLEFWYKNVDLIPPWYGPCIDLHSIVCTLTSVDGYMPFLFQERRLERITKRAPSPQLRAPRL
jgi:hypothetical protein